MKLEALLDRLREFDLLLATDPLLPSVSAIVAGEPVRGSWWSHPRAREIFRLAMALREHADVLLIRLVSGKLTYVHRSLWPAILSIGMAREQWQTEGLSGAARKLLQKVDREGSLSATGDPVRELEARLLARCESVHTEQGAHAKQVRSWPAWASSVGLDGPKLSPAEAKARLESILNRLNQQFQAKGTLPWKHAGTGLQRVLVSH